MSHEALTNFLSQNTLPLDPQNPGPAIDAFLRSASPDLQLLALGECLHGSEDLLRFRNRIFQHLALHDDFRAIALEASFPHARALNAYILTGQGDYDSLRSTALSHGWGQYAATKELIEWMRTYNANPSHETKLHFYGFDLPSRGTGPASPASLFDSALAHLATLDPATAAKHRQTITPLLGQPSQWENPAGSRDPTHNKPLIEAASALRIEAQKLLAALNRHRANFPSTPERLAHEEAAHDAKLARHHLSFFLALTNADDWAPALGARDALQADNLEYIVSRERPRGRVFAFAHNQHLQRSKATWQLTPPPAAPITWSPAGAHFAQTLGSAYAALATALSAADFLQLPLPEPGTLESFLTPNSLTLTKNAPPLPSTYPRRSSTPANPTYFPLTPQSLTDFDALIILSIAT